MTRREIEDILQELREKVAQLTQLCEDLRDKHDSDKEKMRVEWDSGSAALDG